MGTIIGEDRREKKSSAMALAERFFRLSMLQDRVERMRRAAVALHQDAGFWRRSQFCSVSSADRPSIRIC